MPEDPAVEDHADILHGTGRTVAEQDERWRLTKATALSIIAAEVEARTLKSARLRSQRLSRGGQSATAKLHP